MQSPICSQLETELIKTMSLEQIQVLQKCLNELLTRGDLDTKVTETEMTDKLTLLHKGGEKADQVAHWCPVVLFTSLTSSFHMYLTRNTLKWSSKWTFPQDQAGFLQNKSTDINQG